MVLRGLVVVSIEGKGNFPFVQKMYPKAVGVHVVSLRCAGAEVPHPKLHLRHLERQCAFSVSGPEN